MPAVDAPPIGTSAEQLDSTLGAPVATADAADLTYYRRLGADEPLDEELEGGGPATEPERAEGCETRPARQAVPTAGTLTRPSEEEGFTVQIAALRGRADAGGDRRPVGREGVSGVRDGAGAERARSCLPGPSRQVS